ncbi:hypothetical protein GGS24DRAFT_439471 [Hypoxylon argillaceum]|nr:hypothetical protein GGS24DRAFT_439471 [Hypoxylon argillaceum]
MQSGNGKGQDEGGNAAPPSYYEAAQESSQEEAVTAAVILESKRSHHASQAGPTSHHTSQAGPTIDLPFNFPPAYTPVDSHPSGGPSSSAAGTQDYSDLPEAVVASGSGSGAGGGASSSSNAPSSPYLLLAIPQTTPQPTSPFLSAYNTAILLRRGIPRDAFASFLATLSAFLSATVSDRALAHAADVGRSLNDIPKKFSKDTVAHVKGVGRRVGESAKKGDFISASVGAIAGSITIPLAAAFRVVDATIHQFPAAIGNKLARKPPTPRERADAYVAVAQKDWFAARGLSAVLCSTAELPLRGGGRAMAANIVDLAHTTADGGPEGQLLALQSAFGFAHLEIASEKPKPLEIGTSTLWLVLTVAEKETEKMA